MLAATAATERRLGFVQAGTRRLGYGTPGWGTSLGYR